MNVTGKLRQYENGQWQQEPDHIKALELYRRIVREFTKGETRYFDQAMEQIKAITQPTVVIGVSNIFLPGSEIVFSLQARNVRRVDFSLFKIDLTRDVRFSRFSDEDEGDMDTDLWIH
jgi:hypothetical protein